MVVKNIWCSDKWKMDLQGKKLKADICHTSWQNALTVPHHGNLGKYKNRSISILHVMQTYFSSACRFRIIYISIVEPDIQNLSFLSK